MTGVRIDGGTSFGVWSDLPTWNPLFRGVIEAALAWQARRDSAERWDDELEPPDVQLPLPMLPHDANSIGLAGILDEDAVDWRLRGFGDEHGFPIANVQVSAGGRCITLHFRDRAYVTLGRRMEKSTRRVRWYCHVQAKHRELYARGKGPWAVTWLGYFSWLLFGTWTLPQGLRAQGWATTQLHLNADFVGLDFVGEDSRYFVGCRRREQIGHIADDEDEDEDDDGDELEVDDEAGEPLPWQQTFYFGRKTSDVFVRGYRKGDELREVKHLLPESSAYAPHWRHFGWDPDEDGDPFRVEFVFRKKGLVYRRKDSEEVLYDFRDPALLLIDDALRELWAYATTKRRLVDGQARRARECETDARWKIVQSVAERTARADMRQMPHGVVEMLQDERVTRDLRGILDTLQNYAIDQHNTVLETTGDMIAALYVLADELRERAAAGKFSAEAFGGHIFPTPWRSSQGAKRKCHRAQFFHAQIAERHASFAEKLRAYGGDGGCTTLECIGPPPPVELEDAS